MRLFVRSALALVTALVLLPTAAYAQATLSGTVRDTSGAVLPGVTVEAASPVLIEKVRTAITEGNGQFTIVNLRPGTYTVTFTLPGFATVQQAGIQLSGNATTTVNAEMRVGGLEETVTVTGEAPTVDVQTATRQQVLDKDVIDALPTGKMYASLGSLLNGVSTNNAGNAGGALGDTMASLTVHGSREDDQRVMQNGVNTMTLQAGGNIGIAVPNATAAAEVTVNTAGADAEAQTGGVSINYIPKDGGNTFSGTLFYTFTNESLQGSNLTQRLQDAGLTRVNGVKRNQDFNPGFGGPILRDKLWFYFTGRYQQAQSYAAGMYTNKNAFNPNVWTYEADTSKPAFNDSDWKDAQVRFTLQATPKNKVSFTYDQQFRCSCPGGPGTSGVTATRAPEAAAFFRSPLQQLLHAEWSSPVSNNFLLEAVALHRTERWGFMDPKNAFRSSFITKAQEAAMQDMISVQDLGTGLLYRARQNYNNTWVPNYFFRAAATYLTGVHNIKVGFNDVVGYHDQRDYTLTAPVQYRFRNGVPEQVRLRDMPVRYKSDENADLGIFAQDTITLDRLSATIGGRLDYFNVSFPQQTISSTAFVPNRDLTFAAEDNLNWKDFSPRLSAVYDVAGDGKTAVKVSLNRYVAGQTLNGIGRNPNPILRLVRQVDRDWNDANSNFVPDCDLSNNLANGECGQVNNLNFGLPDPNSTVYTDQLRRGFGNRAYNWEFSAGVQREIVPRVSVDVAYFRRWYGNFEITENSQVDASGFDSFSAVVPTVAGLSTSGQTITGLRDVTPALFGVSTETHDVSNLIKENWQGIDVTVNARLQNGVFLYGGISSGRDLLDQCELGKVQPEALTVGNVDTAQGGVLLPMQFCKSVSPWLTSFKANGSYTIPGADVLISASLASTPGPEIQAQWDVSRADALPSLGRNLNQSRLRVTAIQPMSAYGERLNEVDLRLSKLFRFGGKRTSINFDIFNLLNVDTVVSENSNISKFRQPTGTVLGRYMKIGAQFDF